MRTWAGQWRTYRAHSLSARSATRSTGTTSTWTLRENSDFVTPKTTPEGNPFQHEQLGITLQPLKFMEYSLEDVQQTVIFDMSSAVMINVPHPARYALHKLIVYGERAGEHRTKSNKDLQQSALLLEILRNQRQDEVEEAWLDLQSRGPGWKRRVQIGLEALDKLWPQEGFAAWLNSVEVSQDSPPSRPVP